ncbi:MAG: hypothetical protein HOZ81_05145 [Streptomyces sp.]|nr:hypothetical protein [Streptomyces sp.]
MFRRDEPVVVLASPGLPGLVGRRGRIANVRPPADGRWQVAGLRDRWLDLAFPYPTFTAEQLRAGEL